MANVQAIDTFIKHKQWMASKLAARRYGDRQSLEIGNMKDQAFSIAMTTTRWGWSEIIYGPKSSKILENTEQTIINDVLSYVYQYF